jgi:hypothetical protein
MKCRHYACQCARAAELSAMADRTENPEYTAQAIAVHASNQEVTCRRAEDGVARPIEPVELPCGCWNLCVKEGHVKTQNR